MVVRVFSRVCLCGLPGEKETGDYVAECFWSCMTYVCATSKENMYQ